MAQTGKAVSGRVRPAAIIRVTGSTAVADQDLVAVEAPLELWLAHANAPDETAAATSLGLLMRTPGDDEDLAAGVLYTEGIVRDPADLVSLRVERAEPGADRADRVHVVVAPGIDIAAALGARALSATSACGLCGRAALLALDRRAARQTDQPQLAAEVISSLPDQLRASQRAFAETGALHAAGLFSASGEPRVVREDIGRHNAVDKVVGAAFTAGALPATDAVVVVSGRVAYEIVQKAAAAGAAAVVAVGAPSSLAVEAARATGLTLVGFTRDGRFNVYAGERRVVGGTGSAGSSISGSKGK